jgi:tripartite-type tricarboxylate transporter receptor subunit TctC
VKVLLAIFAFAALSHTAAGASRTEAENYPNRPVRLIAASPGTGGDLLARYLAQRLAERWGQQVVVDNRSGAGGMIASEIAAKTAPDGYTLHLGQLSSHATAPSLYRNLSYDPVKDFAPITLYAQVPLIFIAHPSVPAANLRELVALAKQKPGALNYSSGGPGTSGHLGIELLNHTAGIRLTHVPYKGVGVATAAVMSGEAQFAAIPVPIAAPQVKAGKVKAYAITSKARFSGTPDVPTTAEAGMPEVVASTWFGMFVPARTPAELVARLNRDMLAVLRTPAAEAWMLSQGAIPSTGTPQEFAAFIRSEIAKWKKVIEVSGAKVD